MDDLELIFPERQNQPKPPKKVSSIQSKKKSIKHPTKTSRHHDVTTPRNHAIMTSRHHDVMIELIRKTVKLFGKEPSTHRLTLEEKKAITDIIYSYKNRGIKTNENEIARIAINFVINDYRQNGENSILHKVIRALNE